MNEGDGEANDGTVTPTSPTIVVSTEDDKTTEVLLTNHEGEPRSVSRI